MNFSINNKITKPEIVELGLSALAGRTPALRDAKGRPFEPKYDHGLKFLTSDSVFQHVDFEAEYPLTVTFDMENPVKFEKALVVGFGNPKNYALAEYELYAANSEAELYNEQNRVAIYNNVEPSEQDASCNVLFEFETAKTARFFGLKVIKPCVADNIARIARVGVYSEEYARNYTYIDKHGANLAKGLDPEIIDDDGCSTRFYTVFGTRAFLNDGIAFDPFKTTRLKLGHTKDAIYRFGKKVDINKVVIAHNEELPTVEVFASTDIKTLYDNKLELQASTETVGESKLTVFEFPTTECSCCAIRFIKGEIEFLEISEIAVMSPLLTVDASSGTVINDKFVGNGENHLPFCLQPGNRAGGYTDELFASDCNRVIKTKPGLIRFWMQVDWFEKQKGVYDFDSVEMEAVWRYFELFKASGSEVQLTHSWKVGPDAQEWFSIPGVPEPRNSAPVDLEHYAEGYSMLMQEIWRRGYDNVRHVSFANEPGFSWDFQCFGNRKDYYCKMVRAVHDRFVADGIRDKCIFWCCESAEDVTWIEYCREYIDDCVDYYTLHCYMCPEDQLEETMMKKVRDIGALPYLLTECSENGADMKNPWNRSLAGLLVESSNLGGGGIVMWTLHGIKSMSVTSPDSWTMNEQGHLWNAQNLDKVKGGMPNLNYYIMALATRYVPMHSKVLKTDVLGEGMHAATFLSPDGDITVMVECKKVAADRAVKIKLPSGKYRLEKHVYNPSKLNPTYDAIIPENIETIECDGTFIDSSVPTDYCTIVYTTIPAQGQIALSDTRIALDAGESYQFSARLIDCEGEVKYSTMDGKGRITESGLFTAEGLNSGDMVAVMATLKSDPSVEGIAIIDIR